MRRRSSGGSEAIHARYSDRKSTRLNSSHSQISYAVFCLKKKNISKPLDLDAGKLAHDRLRKRPVQSEFDLNALRVAQLRQKFHHVVSLAAWPFKTHSWST